MSCKLYNYLGGDYHHGLPGESYIEIKYPSIKIVLLFSLNLGGVNSPHLVSQDASTNVAVSKHIL